MRVCHTVAEAQKVTTLSRSKLYEMISSGVLPSFKIGSRRLIHDDDLRGCLDKFRKREAA